MRNNDDRNPSDGLPTSRLVPGIVAGVAGIMLVVNHALAVYQGEYYLAIVLLAPMFLLLGAGGVVDPRIVWSIGPRGRDLPMAVKAVGAGLAVAGLLLSAVLAFAVYGFPNLGP